MHTYGFVLLFSFLNSSLFQKCTSAQISSFWDCLFPLPQLVLTTGSAASTHSPALPHLWLQTPLSYSALGQIFLPCGIAGRTLQASALIWGFPIPHVLSCSENMLFVVSPSTVKLTIIQHSQLTEASRGRWDFCRYSAQVNKEYNLYIYTVTPVLCLCFGCATFIPALSYVQHQSE